MFSCNLNVGLWSLRELCARLSPLLLCRDARLQGGLGLRFGGACGPEPVRPAGTLPGRRIGIGFKTSPQAVDWPTLDAVSLWQARA